MSTRDLLTPTCQPSTSDTFTATPLLAALEATWTAIRTRHTDVPDAVLIIGAGSTAKANQPLKYGHFASLRWQHAGTRLPEVLIGGEGLKRPASEVVTTLLHEAAHGIADTRGVKDTSRQGRWHNKHFAAHALELGLTPTKDTRLGWSPCTLPADTAATYAEHLAALAAVLKTYRHPEPTGDGTRSSNNGLSCECDCGRRIRIAKAVYEQGSIICALCDGLFTPDDDPTGGPS